MNCNNCGYFNNDANTNCEMCGAALLQPVSNEAEASGFNEQYCGEYPQQNYQHEYVQPAQSFAAEPVAATASADKDPGQVLGIVALVAGVVSILAICCTSILMPVLSLVALPFSIAAIVCGALGMKKSKEAGKTNVMAIIGLVIGVLSILAVVASIVLFVFGIGAAIMLEGF